MKLIKTIFLMLCSATFISACNFTILPGTPDDKSYLRNKNGNIVQDCQGKSLFKNWSDSFWEKNNLPKGTTDFICKNGKAFLPD